MPDPRALPVLYRLASLASRAAEPGAALREVLDLLVAAFQADAGSIALLSADTGHLEIEVQTGAPPAETYHQLKLGHGITGWAVLNRRSLLVPDVKAEPRYIAVRPAARCEMAVLDTLEAALTTARATAASLLASTVAGLHAP